MAKAEDVELLSVLLFLNTIADLEALPCRHISHVTLRFWRWVGYGIMHPAFQ